jgi:hypothetical protein
MDVLPDMQPRPRSEEIVAWLEAHPAVKLFAVIDDDDDCLDPFGFDRTYRQDCEGRR